MKRVKFQDMLAVVRESLEQVPEHRTGQNTRYSIAEAGLGAFSVFYMQSRSFLAHQRDMQRKKGQNNVHSLFGVERVPSDGQIRNLLDPIEPAQLREPFWEIHRRLEQSDHLEQYRGVGGTYLVSLDGSQYFSSQEIHCPNCRVTVLDEKTYYSHLVMLAVLSALGKKQVFCLDPEFRKSSGWKPHRLRWGGKPVRRKAENEALLLGRLATGGRTPIPGRIAGR